MKKIYIFCLIIGITLLLIGVSVSITLILNHYNNSKTATDQPISLRKTCDSYKSCVNSVNKGKLVKCQGKCDSQTCCEAIKTCDRL